MIKKQILIVVFLGVACYSHLFSQNRSGIRFDSTLNWQEIKQKAAREKKFIFIDCYASWCGPCKAMDNDIYTLDNIGEEFNRKFISVKLQFDNTNQESRYKDSWHKVSEAFQREYNLPGFPSYLFFTPEGKIVHRAAGYKSKEAFLELGKDAVDSTKQFYPMVERFYSGKINDIKEIRNFLLITRNAGDRKLSLEVATMYKKMYLDKIPVEKLCELDYLIFISNYPQLVTSHDNFFKLLMKYPAKCDSLKPGINSLIINSVIEREEIVSRIPKNSQDSINWSIIILNINRKYGQRYSTKLVPPVRKQIAFKTKNWNEFARLQDEEIRNGINNSNCDYASYSWDLNMSAWNTYLECADSTILIRALAWSDLSIQLVSSKKPSPTEQLYDTKARLLYKLGRIDEAVEYEQKAISAGIEIAQISGGCKGYFYDDYIVVLEKMKNLESIEGLK